MTKGRKYCTRNFAYAFLGVLWCGQALAEPLQEVTIGLGSSSLAGGSARIVKELGLFEKHGLDARLVVTDSGNVSLAALTARSYKVVVCGFTELVTARALGQDVLAVVPTYVGLGVNLVLAKDVAAGLTVRQNAPLNDRLKALKDLVIGTASPNSVATVSLKSAAEAAGINVRFANMTYDAMTPALSNGSIQGFISAAPFWAQAIVAGKAVEWVNVKQEFPAQFVPTMSAVLATRRDVADSEPELIRKVAASFGELRTAVVERPKEVKAAIAKLYPNLDGPTLDLLFDIEAASWKSEPVTADQVRREIAYLKLSGLAPKQIDDVDPAKMLFN